MAGILSKDIKISLDGTDIPNLQEIPDLGGAAEQVDITVLTDGNYKYINGIKDFGSLDFTFLYDNSTATSNYRMVRAAEEDEQVHQFVVTFPDTTTFTFGGQVSTAIVGAGVNAALQFTMTVNLNTDITVGNPSANGEVNPPAEGEQH